MALPRYLLCRVSSLSGAAAQGRVSIRSAMHPRSLSTVQGSERVAVLFQALEPPVIGGVRKPKKPGGYRDSCADIAYVLDGCADISVVTPAARADPGSDDGWCFPDTEDGILEAVNRGATHIWANTILFAQHPLQVSEKLSGAESVVRVVGQPPVFVESFDDKNFVNTLLRSSRRFSLPKAATVSEISELQAGPAAHLTLPVVGKPVRGRGSHGVRVCRTHDELRTHVEALLSESPLVILEEYLAGQEGTVTVMPPCESHPSYWSMPFVTRFNHADGIAPYNGVTAVTQNSRVLSQQELDSDPSYARIARQCEQVAELLQCSAPIRVDVRRFQDDSRSEFALFDVNMKPNMTGPGRPGREDQASLTAMAAASLGWEYPRLLREVLESARTLYQLRNAKLPDFKG